MLVGTPSYFQAPARPTTPADLEAQSCINYRLVGGGGLPPWELERDGREVKVRPGGPLTVDEEAPPRAAVRAGAGLGYMMEHDVRDRRPPPSRRPRSAGVGGMPLDNVTELVQRIPHAARSGLACGPTSRLLGVVGAS